MFELWNSILFKVIQLIFRVSWEHLLSKTLKIQMEVEFRVVLLFSDLLIGSFIDVQLLDEILLKLFILL